MDNSTNTVTTLEAPEDGGDIIHEAPVYWKNSIKRWETNAKYTCLAVNNLHHLAEALEDLIKWTIPDERRWNQIAAIEKAKEALNRIS